MVKRTSIRKRRTVKWGGTDGAPADGPPADGPGAPGPEAGASADGAPGPEAGAGAPEGAGASANPGTIKTDQSQAPAPAPGAVTAAGAAGALGALGAAGSIAIPAPAPGGVSPIISKVMKIAYLVTTGFAFVMLIVMIILVIYNYVEIEKLAKKEKEKTINNTILVRDTMEYKLMSFAIKKGSNSMIPINALINVVNIAFITVCILFALLVVHILITMSLFFMITKKGNPTAPLFEAIKLDIEPKVAYAMGIIGGITAIISITMYIILKSMFADKAIKQLYKMTKAGHALKRMVAENIYAERNFLDNINNVSAVKDAVSRVTKPKTNTYNPEAAFKMIYTFNVYNHYKNMVAATSTERSEFNKRFTYIGFKGKSASFHPVEFLLSNTVHDFQSPDYFYDEVKDATDKRDRALKSTYLNMKIRGVTLQEYVRNKMGDLTRGAQEFNKNNMKKNYNVIYKVIRTAFNTIFIFTMVFMVIMFILVLVFKPTRELLINAFSPLTDFLIKLLKGNKN